MKVVLDTNVFVSAFLSPGGVPAGILNLFLNDKIILLFDNRILAEYAEVLARPKFGFSDELVAPFLEYIHLKGEYVIANPVEDRMKDDDDRKFLEVARSGGASFLVTGNHAHFPEDKTIVSPAEFLAAYFK